MLPALHHRVKGNAPGTQLVLSVAAGKGCGPGGGAGGRPPEGFQPRLCLISGIDHRGRDVGGARSSIGLNSPRKQEGSRMIGSRHRWNSLRRGAARLMLCGGATALALALAAPMAMAQQEGQAQPKSTQPKPVAPAP